MVKSQEEKSTSTSSTETPEVTKTSTGKVYNFTRNGFIVEANSLKEAQEALKVHLKDKKEEAK